MVWDSATNRPVGSDGTARSVPFLCSREQAERWHEAGFSVPKAVDLDKAIFVRCSQAEDEDEIDAIIDAWLAEERARAVAAVGEDDPDLVQFDLAIKRLY